MKRIFTHYKGLSLALAGPFFCIFVVVWIQQRMGPINGYIALILLAISGTSTIQKLVGVANVRAARHH